MVMTPVPPMPVTMIDQGRSSAAAAGSGRTGNTAPSPGKLLALEAADQLAAFDGDEARAETLEAGIVLVAGRLIDLPLAAEGRLDRRDGDAVRLDAAIAAAFADELVDEDALVGIGELAALAPPALLGGTGLVIDDDADVPGDVHELLLHRLQIVAVMEGDMRREAGVGRIFVGLVGDDGDALDALGAHLLRDHAAR